jgi:hypothetical protein
MNKSALAPRSFLLGRLAVGVALGAGIFVGALNLTGCGSGDSRRPTVKPPTSQGGEGGAGPGLGGAGPGSSGGRSGAPDCDEGEQKECTVYVQQASGVTSCWYGIQFCVDGEFTECLDPGTALTPTGTDG